MITQLPPSASCQNRQASPSRPAAGKGHYRQFNVTLLTDNPGLPTSEKEENRSGLKWYRAAAVSVCEWHTHARTHRHTTHPPVQYIIYIIILYIIILYIIIYIYIYITSCILYYIKREAKLSGVRRAFKLCVEGEFNVPIALGAFRDKKKKLCCARGRHYLAGEREREREKKQETQTERKKVTGGSTTHD